jgi:hypothetical protein
MKWPNVNLINLIGKFILAFLIIYHCSLVCGEINGKINQLYARVKNVLKKNPDFEVSISRVVCLQLTPIGPGRPIYRGACVYSSKVWVEITSAQLGAQILALFKNLFGMYQYLTEINFPFTDNEKFHGNLIFNRKYPSSSTLVSHEYLQ